MPLTAAERQRNKRVRDRLAKESYVADENWARSTRRRAQKMRERIASRRAAGLPIILYTETAPGSYILDFPEEPDREAEWASSLPKGAIKRV